MELLDYLFEWHRFAFLRVGLSGDYPRKILGDQLEKMRAK
jgi:hypothetical protein